MRVCTVFYTGLFPISCSLFPCNPSSLISLLAGVSGVFLLFSDTITLPPLSLRLKLSSFPLVPHLSISGCF